ncbi:SMP-30/gluconolactonase/LRE family protein [Shimia sp. R10_1]|uniref:SMP-30/gluconolactonase/LRE family protein n=1 Tax=Shimia sp. R10_1 TaxID=2821095 RepID=UPI001ADB9765|nr:SMP-30/gluconolactonase/LRE family protein [Shimia sp. R10_1]MBO9474454.1 SMP-30/gluconolactonase/LRE family protein [Shimia sp. R10_1]
MSAVFDNRVCELGEGPLWHPVREQLFWFDIKGKRLLTQRMGDTQEWQFDEHFSAAGWVDEDTLIVASETALWRMDLETGLREHVIALEADNPVTRSNDGRADRWGGFWIGTMGKAAEAKAGAIYRFYKGELRQVVGDITISNAICFDQTRACAYYTDTPTGQVMRQSVDPVTGWPQGAAEVYLDLKPEGLNPDGAVVDAEGTVWIAQWGASRVAAYDPEGRFVKAVEVGALQASCPAFGGPELRDLYITTAAEDLAADVLAAAPENGMTFVQENAGQGVAEPRVIL